ncbi:MAG: hypothetical protein NTY86_23195 [Deltaproteobacteria bacterium]|nr:hypothetical protein [Deltaproteobacteria bacterium]
MAFILRKVRKNRWYKGEAESALSINDVPADPLGDLQTNCNALSIWLIDDEKSNLDQVASALAVDRGVLSNLDYALLDFKYFNKLKFKYKSSRGGTLDNRINECHIDIQELSGKKLVRLAKAFFRYAEIQRIPEKKVLELIKKAIESKQIDSTKIKPAIIEKI